MAWQLAALASVVLSGIVAIHGGARWPPTLGAQSPWNRCVAMLLLYVGTSLVVWLLFNLVSGFMARLRLKEFDRQLGGVFGAVKGVLWCVVITFFAVTLSEPGRQAVLKSYSGYYIAVLTERARPILPQEVRAVLGKYIDESIGNWIRSRRVRRRRSGRPTVRVADRGGGGMAGLGNLRGFWCFPPNIRNIIGRWKGVETTAGRPV